MALRIISDILNLKLWNDTGGQDMLEYGLYAAAVCLLYAAVSPSVAVSVSTIFSKIATNVAAAATT